MYLLQEPVAEVSVAYSMALDATISDLNLKIPVLRLYSLRQPGITLGFRQNPGDCLLWSGVQKYGLQVSYRTTGGKSVLHQNSLTYSVIVPKTFLPSSVVDSYRLLSGPVLEALRPWCNDLRFALGPSRSHPANPNCFLENEVESILNGLGRKIVGSAQRRLRKNVLQHGEIRLFPTSIPHRDIFKMDFDRSRGFDSQADKPVSLFSSFKPDLEVRLKDEILSKFEIMFGKSTKYRLRCRHHREVQSLAHRLRVDFKPVRDPIRRLSSTL
jgi:lipoate-protein ligase A